MSARISQSATSLELQIQAFETGMSPDKMDALINEMFSAAGESGELVCRLIDKGTILMQSANETLSDTSLRLAKSKFRTLCARFAVLCSQWSGKQLSPFGDCVDLEHPKTRQRYSVCFENADGKLEIAIQLSLQSTKSN